MNKQSILSYVKLYPSILARHHIFLEDRDLAAIYRLILLVFELDDLYDRIRLYSLKKSELIKIEQEMISLIPNCNPIGVQAITSVFQAMKDESLLKADRSLNLNQYLSVCRQSIGSSIIAAYLASKKQLPLNIWYSDFVMSFNNEINELIRLANDLLDIDTEKLRNNNEVSQIKASCFFASKTQFKSYFLYRYIVHRLRYFLYLFRFKYLKLDFSSKEYIQAIACSESVLELAFQAYIKDRNSCQ